MVGETLAGANTEKMPKQEADGTGENLEGAVSRAGVNIENSPEG